MRTVTGMVEFMDSPMLGPMISHQVRVFLAGGITGCPDWQSDLKKLIYQPCIVFNPRRANFPMDDPNAARDQITWERLYLDSADIVSFWFAAETIQPIVLLEFGRFIDTKKQIVVGVHPDYPRRADVEIQLSLARPQEEVLIWLDDVGKRINEMVAELAAARADLDY